MMGVKESIRRVESEESPTSNDSLELDRERTSGMKKAHLEAGQASRGVIPQAECHKLANL